MRPVADDPRLASTRRRLCFFDMGPIVNDWILNSRLKTVWNMKFSARILGFSRVVIAGFIHEEFTPKKTVALMRRLIACIGHNICLI